MSLPEPPEYKAGGRPSGAPLSPSPTEDGSIVIRISTITSVIIIIFIIIIIINFIIIIISSSSSSSSSSSINYLLLVVYDLFHCTSM